MNAAHYQSTIAAEDAAHRAYLAALPPNAWEKHFRDHIRTVAGAAASLLTRHVGELRQYMAAADALEEERVAAELRDTFRLATDTVLDAMFGREPDYPLHAPTAAPRVQYYRDVLDQRRRVVAHAGERLDGTVQGLIDHVAAAAEVGDSTFAHALAAVALDAYPRSTAVHAASGGASTGPDRWRREYQAARVARETDPDTEAVEDVTAGLADAIAHVLACHDTPAARELLDILIREAAPASDEPPSAVDRPGASLTAAPEDAPGAGAVPVIEVDFRPAPRSAPTRELPPAAVGFARLDAAPVEEAYAVVSASASGWTHDAPGRRHCEVSVCRYVMPETPAGQYDPPIFLEVEGDTVDAVEPSARGSGGTLQFRTGAALRLFVGVALNALHMADEQGLIEPLAADEGCERQRPAPEPAPPTSVKTEGALA